jgi:hypothetical protein
MMSYNLLDNKLRYLCLFFVLIVSTSFCQTPIQNGPLSGTLLKSGSPYYIYGDIIIPSDSLLTLQHGVHLIFYGHYKLLVYGRLNAEGVLNDSIYFSVSDTIGFSDTSTINGGWHGVKFFNQNPTDTSLIRYCNLGYCKGVGQGVDDRNGGAIYTAGVSNVRIEHSNLHNNLSVYAGGAIFSSSGTSLQISESRLVNNRTFKYGGGIYIDQNCYTTIENNTIAYNSAHYIIINGQWVFEGGTGGGIYIANHVFNTPRIINNFILNNFAIGGGGIYESSARILISDNVICNNSTSGIWNGHSMGEGKYYNNTVCNNGDWAGIQVSSQLITLVNNIIWGNTNILDPGNQIFFPPQGQLLQNVSYSDIQNGYPGEGNIDTNPEFVNPTAGTGNSYNALNSDWSIENSSPCINKGNPDTTGMLLPIKDIAGNPRIYGGRIEIGAYENQVVVAIPKISKEPIESFLIAPNPCKDYISFYFSTEGVKTSKISIYNSLGKLVRVFNISDYGHTSYYIGDLLDGLYYALCQINFNYYKEPFIKIN